jgi:hypothetical protein
VFPRAPSSPPVPAALAARTPGLVQGVPVARASSESSGMPLLRQTVTLPPPPPRRLPSIAPLPSPAPVAPEEVDTTPGLVIGTTPDELDAALAALEATMDVPFEDFLAPDAQRDGKLPETLREKIKLGPPHAPAPPPRRQG